MGGACQNWQFSQFGVSRRFSKCQHFSTRARWKVGQKNGPNPVNVVYGLPPIKNSLREKMASRNGHGSYRLGQIGIKIQEQLAFLGITSNIFTWGREYFVLYGPWKVQKLFVGQLGGKSRISVTRTVLYTMCKHIDKEK